MEMDNFEEKENIQNNVNRKKKRLWTDKNYGEKITFYHAQTHIDEAKFVVDKIIKNAEEYPYKDCAILYRNNFQSRVVEDELVKRNVPYKIVGTIISLYINIGSPPKKSILNLFLLFSVIKSTMDMNDSTRTDKLITDLNDIVPLDKFL